MWGNTSISPVNTSHLGFLEIYISTRKTQEYITEMLNLMSHVEWEK
jgi:hypothetical protein